MSEQLQVGSPVGSPVVYRQAPPTNTLATLSLIFGLLGLGVVAIVLGHIALAQLNRRPVESGRGLALAGLILGYVETALLVILFWFTLAVPFLLFALAGGVALALQ